MSKALIGAKVPKDVEQRFEAFKETHGLNKTEAVERLLDRGLTYYGYENGHARTFLERTCGKLARALLIVAVSFLLVTLATGVRLYLPVVTLIASAGGLMFVQQAEPGLTREVRRLR